MSLSLDASDAIFVISGDIAFSGTEREYLLALDFLSRMRSELQERQPTLGVHFITVPGNHDCFLPAEETSLRELLVKGVVPSIEGKRPDRPIVQQLLKSQQNYSKFEQQLYGESSAEPWTVRTREVQVAGRVIRFNLFNTALLSQRVEAQAQLYLPLDEIDQLPNISAETALSISVFHHSFLWFESNNAVRFRLQVERLSDIALMGHQHYSHNFYKTNTTGEKILYLEGGALQDEHVPQQSFFNLLLYDFERTEERTLSFRWSKDIFIKKEDSGWRAIQLNRVIRDTFEVSTSFSEFLAAPGATYRHNHKLTLKLQDIYIYPNLRVSSIENSSTTEIHGFQIVDHFTKCKRAVVQGPARSGKTAMAKMLFSDFLRKTQILPLYLDGERVKQSKESRIDRLFESQFEEQYSTNMLEKFRQKPSSERALLLDNWHATPLNGAGQRAFLEVASRHFGILILFTDELFEIHEFANPSESTFVRFEKIRLGEFGPILQGQLIDKWLTLGREQILTEQQLQLETEELERLLRDVLGKNTLPAFPFIILCVFQAHQDKKLNAPEDGSFGYLYEVLVTAALSKSLFPKPQLDKKYTFLSWLAFQMFRDGVDTKTRDDVSRVAEQYSESHMVTLDIGKMLEDLEFADVLVRSDGNYSFKYSHLFHYFVARYFQENLRGAAADDLQLMLAQMIDLVADDRNLTIIVFLTYFLKDNGQLLARLIQNANQLFHELEPATLEKDVEFLTQLGEIYPAQIQDEYDVKQNRLERRKFREEMEKNEETLVQWQQSGKVPYKYSDDLSFAQKVELAQRYIQIFGHLIRNSPGRLPGDVKVQVLTTTYLLGLRGSRAILEWLSTATPIYKEAVQTAIERNEMDDEGRELSEVVKDLIAFVARIVAMGSIKQISSAVGIADLEKAYAVTLDKVGRTRATRLIDLSIRLDHLGEVPISLIEELHKLFGSTSFADVILTDLIAYHFSMFDVDRRTIQRVVSIFRTKQGTPTINTAQLLQLVDRKKT